MNVTNPGSHAATDLVGHQLLRHHDQKTEWKLSIRTFEYDESLCYKIYRSNPFSVLLTELQKQQENGTKIHIDKEWQKVLHKSLVTNSGDEHTDECDTSIDQQVNPNGQGITINWSWSRFHSSNGNTSDGTLSTTNMALPLLLDVGIQLQDEQFQTG